MVRLQRRAFLATGGQAILAAVLSPVAAATNTKLRSGKAITRLNKELAAQLERRIPRLMAEALLPGLAIAIVRDARLTWCRGFGLADTESGRRVDCTTMFEAQSLSKPVFAYVVLKLCEKRTLDLDTPLTAYTPDRILTDDPRLDRITPRHVLSHTSGLQNWRSQADPLRIHFNPGEKWLYSGEGYSYLQSVVTHLTGHTDPSACRDYDVKVCASDIADYMKSHLLVPFGMTSSEYVWNAGLATRLARAHDDHAKVLPEHRWSAIEAARWAAAGGLLSTPADYARFLIEVINPRPSDNFRLNRHSLEEMTRPVTEVPDENRPCSWGLGWKLLDTAGGTAIAHGGDGLGFHSFAAASVAHRSAFVVMTNGEGGRYVVEQLIAPASMDRLLRL